MVEVTFRVTVDFKAGEYLPDRLSFHFSDEADSRESFLIENDKWAKLGAHIQLWKIVNTRLESSGPVVVL